MVIFSIITLHKRGDEKKKILSIKYFVIKKFKIKKLSKKDKVLFMSFFKIFQKAQEKAKPEFESGKSKTAIAIINRFYSDYPETPYISNDRERAWIGRAESFPEQSIISKEMMTRFENGLLPGHIYMLYWLKRYTNKSVPVYFEYKYGIDFEKEKLFLKNNGFLNDLDKPTEKGEEAISKYYSVIEKHTPPKPDRSVEGITKQILKQRDSICRNGFKEYTFIANSGCCAECQKLHNKHFPVSKFKIGVNAPPMHEGCRCSIAAYSERK